MKVVNKISLALAILGSLSISLFMISMSDDLAPFLGLGMLLLLFAILVLIFSFKNGLYALLLTFYFIATWFFFFTKGNDVYFNGAYRGTVMVLVPAIFIAVAMFIAKRKGDEKINLFAYIGCIRYLKCL